MATFKQDTNSLAGTELPIRAVLDRACTIRPASGAVLALRSGDKMICAATMGAGVPEIGSELGSHGSLSALCVQTATTLRCDSAEHDARVDQQSCRELGIESVVAAPVAYMNQVVGLLEIFSEQKYAFANHDVAKVQLLASLILIALMKSSELLAIGAGRGMQ
jgi:diguanylate cyclase